MKKTTKIFICVLVLALLVLLGCIVIQSKTAKETALVQLPEEEVPVRFLTEDSCFHDFQINEALGQVELRCELVFCNQTDEEQSFTVYACFESDQKGGLLRQGTLEGVTGETGQTTLVLGPGETADYDIRFIGEYGGKPQKVHRELPEEITVHVNEESYTWKTREKDTETVFLSGKEQDEVEKMH